METTELELQSPPAEEALIGAVAYHADALAGVLASLPGTDFYKPARGTVWDACRELSADHKPVDPVTVARHLSNTGDWNVSTQHVVTVEMSNAAPAIHARQHADTVADLARRRELLRAVNRARGIVINHPGDASDALAAARAILDDLDRDTTTQQTNGGTLSWPQLVDEFEAAHAPGNITPGIPSPWWELDELIGGLHAGRMYTVGGRPGAGKALALDTPIPTPHGWTTMGELKAGDVVMGADGLPTHVTEAYEVRTDRPCFEVEFSDGSIIVADAEHQWLTETRASRRSASEAVGAPRTSPLSRDQRYKKTYPSVVTTAEIAATLRTETADHRLNHSVATCEALQLPAADLLLPPYTLGMWLGDGTTAAASYTSADGTVTARLRTIGVLGNKHIPGAYLRGSESQRRALLAGLLDSDGTVTPGGQVQFCVTNHRLASDTRELIASLGYRVSWTTKRVPGRSEASSTAYILGFATPDEVFRLERKRLIHKERRAAARSRNGRRYVVDVRPTPSVPVRCIEVGNADHLYLAGRSMIPTHNSTAALNIAEHAATESNRNVLIFSKEMPTVDVTGRLLAKGAQVDLRAINHHAIDDLQMARIRHYLTQVGSPHLHVNASPVNLSGIKTLTRAHHHRHGLDLLVVDYLQLVHTDTPGRTREQEVGRVSRELKALAMELGIVVVVPAQLNRGPAGRADARPAMSDLRDSGQIEQDSDAVILLWHQLRDGQRTGEVTLIVDKNRHGPKGEINLRWHGGYGAIG